MIKSFVVALSTFLTASIFSVSYGNAQQRTKIRMAFGALGVSNLLMQAAQDWKFFADNGLNVESILMRSAISAITLSRGEVDFVSGVGPASVAGTIGGIQAKAIWISQNRLSYKLVAKQRFKGIQDLKSKRIGVMGIGALNHVSLTMAMEKVGVNPKDFTYIATPPSLILTALETGTIDAASLNPPFLIQALGKGYHVLLDIADLVQMPSGGLTALTKTIETRPNDVKRMIKSLQQAKEAFVQSKERSLRLMKDSLKLDQDEALRTYEMVRPGFAGDGIPGRIGMQNIVRTLHAQGLFTDRSIQFEDVADARYAREVAEELGYKVNEKE